MPVRALFAVALAVVCVDHAHAQSNAMVIVDYPVADLVIPFPYGQKDDKRPTCENELIAAIRKKVAPASWDEAGGEGRMDYLGKDHILHVYQTRKVHAELKAFLKQIERGQVSVEMRVVIASEATFDRFDRGKIQWTKKDGIEYAPLNEVGVDRFLTLIQCDRRSHVMQMPKMTVYDGQECKLFPSSLESQILPTISTDRRFVTLQAMIENKDRNGAMKARVGGGTLGEFKVAAVAKVPDQHTVAFLAGKTMIEESSEQFPPMVANVPYVNRLFRKVERTTTPVHVIVLLTPRIIRMEEEELEVRPLREIQAPDDWKFPLLRSAVK
jgi:hypothetical protein